VGERNARPHSISGLDWAISPPSPGPEQEIPTGQQGRNERETATARLLTAYRHDGDTRARDRLVQLYLPLVEAFAHRYGRRGAEYEDLVQVGSIGLLNAIERCDPKRGDEFAAFAVPTVAGEIKRHLRDRTQTVRLPRRLREAALRLPATRQQLTGRLGREPEPRELVDALGVAEEDLHVLLAGERPSEQSEAGPGDALTGGEIDDRILLADAFRSLDETERSIIYLRFVRELSRRETAAQLGMTEDRLRRRTQAALVKLRGELERGAFPGAPGERASANDEPVGEAPAASGPAGDGPSTPANVSGESGRAGSDTAKNGGHSGRILVRMPQSLHEELAQAAEREKVSMNQFITNALSAAVGWQRSGAPPSRAPRWLPAAIVTNIVVLALAGIAALILLLVALDRGI
jgi:RNA polymerase sigma-B factor